MSRPTYRVSSRVSTPPLATRSVSQTRPIRLALIAGLVVALSLFVLPSPAANAQDADATISADGVGGALVGSTVDQLREQLGNDYQISNQVRITVDFDGHVVSRDGAVQFRAVKAGEGDELTLFIVNNQRFATAEGVGPGTTIADAEGIYGDATLSRNPDNENREFVSFENHPADNIAFRTPGIAGTYVGIYDDDSGESTDYEDTGVIAAIWISCDPGVDCPITNDQAADADADAEADADADAEGGDAEDTDGEDADAEDTDGEDADAEDAADAEDSAPDDADTQATDPDDLAETGAEHVILVASASSLFVVGGAMVIFYRSFLAPAWLRSRRW